MLHECLAEAGVEVTQLGGAAAGDGRQGGYVLASRHGQAGQQGAGSAEDGQSCSALLTIKCCSWEQASSGDRSMTLVYRC